MLLIFLLASLAACDKIAQSPSTYTECLGSRLKDIHTAEASAALISACRSDFPLGSELRRSQRLLLDVDVNGKASADERYGIASTFSGTLYNPSAEFVVTEVLLKLNLKAKPDTGAASAPAWKPPLTYRAQVLILPLSSSPFSVPILADDSYSSDWGVVAVYGVPVSVVMRQKN